MRRKAKEQEHDALCNPASIEIFTTWYAFGGEQRGLSPTEVLLMPAWLRQDFLLIKRYVSDERERRRKWKPKEPKPRRR